MTTWVLGTIFVVAVVLLAGAWVLWNMLMDDTDSWDHEALAGPDSDGAALWCQWCDRVHATKLLNTDNACCNRCFAEFFEECPSCGDTVESGSIFTFKGETMCTACGPDEADDE
jgi:hypothetical protein